MFGIPLRDTLEMSPADLEAHFTLFECQRWQEFNTNVSEYQQKTVDDEKSQRAGDLLRTSDFDRMMADIGVTFAANEQRRETLYLEAEIRQETAFHMMHDKVRQEMFSSGESNRTSSFQQAQDMRAKRAEWYAAIRETHFREGRVAREAICEDVEKALIQQFEDIRQGQEEAFVSEEQRRDDLVKESLVDEEYLELRAVAALLVMVSMLALAPSGKSLEDSFSYLCTVPAEPPEKYPKDSLEARHSSRSPCDLFLHNSDDCTPTRAIRIPRSERKHPQSGQSQSFDQMAPIISPLSCPPMASTINQVPQKSSAALTPPRPSIAPVVVQELPVVPLRRRRRRRRPFAAPNIVEVPQEPPSESSTSTGPISQNAAGSDYDERFRYNEGQRQQSFLNDEEFREIWFEEAEAIRNEAERTRWNLLMRTEKSYARNFRIVMVTHEQRFEGREDARTRGEARCCQRAEAGVAGRARAFDQAILYIHRHYAAVDDLENDICNFMKKKVETLDRKQREILSVARKYQSVRFENSQAQRAEDLKTKLPREQLMSFFQSLLGPPRSRSQARSSLGSFLRQMSVASYLQPRPRSPTAGFAPSAIFKGANFQTSLPTPGDEAHQPGEETFQSQYRHVWEKSQAEREIAFESGAQRRRHAFSLKEKKRQLEFEKMLKDGKEKFNEEEGDRERAFRAAQHEREMRFLAMEASRESAFRDAEITRAADFIRAQEQMEGVFHSTQEKLRKAGLESEERRLLDLESWASDLLKERERDQASQYYIQEADRKAVFKRSLKYSTLKSSIPHAAGEVLNHEVL